MTNYRAAHFLDIENLCGTGQPTLEEMELARKIYEEEVGIQEEDLVVVAAGTQNKRLVRNVWPIATHIFRAGQNGADIAIAQFICESKSLATRFGRAFLGSGDGGFAPYAKYLIDLGLDTVVVARERGLSWQLNGFERILIPNVRPLCDYKDELRLAA
jgi:hypothetical protein